MMKTRLTVVLLSALLLSACDGSDSKPAPDPRQQQDIQSVKQLIYPYDRTVTLGGILDNRSECTETEWDTLTDDKGRELVMYRCHYNTADTLNYINSRLETRYRAALKNVSGQLSKVKAWQRTEIKTRTDQSISTAEKELGMINALSGFDSALLHSEISTGNDDNNRNIRLSAGKLWSPRENDLNEEQRDLIKQWNSITESLSFNEGNSIDSWFENPSDTLSSLKQELAELKAVQAQEHREGDDRRREDEAALTRALAALEAAHAESKDWQVTQELMWSVTGGEPVFTGGRFLLDDRNGQHELRPHHPVSRGPVSRGPEMLADIYGDRTGTDAYRDMVAFGLYLHQVKDIRVPSVSPFGY